jgi:hypothetical protein
MPHAPFNTVEFAKYYPDRRMLESMMAKVTLSTDSASVRALIEEYMLTHKELSADTTALLSFILVHHRTLLKTTVVSDTSWCNIKFLVRPEKVYDLSNPKFRIDGDVERKLVCYTRNASRIFINLSSIPTDVNANQSGYLVHPTLT